MTDPFSLASRLLISATSSVQSATSLYQTAEGLQTSERSIWELKEELNSLRTALFSLAGVVTSVDAELTALELPLMQCSKACNAFEALLVKFKADDNKSSPGNWNWAELMYMGKDISGFRSMLARYKSIITVALAGVNIRNSKVTIEILKEYKTTIKNVTSDLEEHIKNLDKKLLELLSESAGGSSEIVAEWRQIQEERDSARQCIHICTQVYVHIEQVQPNLLENISTSSNWYHRRTISHENEQYLAKHTQYSEQAGQERVDIFENISTAEDGTQVIVSTFAEPGYLMSARHIKAGARSTQMIGRMCDDSLQKISQDHVHTASEQTANLQTGVNSQSSSLRINMGLTAVSAREVCTERQDDKNVAEKRIDQGIDVSKLSYFEPISVYHENPVRL